MKDILGALCSGACILHCLALPILAAGLTSMAGFALLTSESAHLWIALAMMVFALWSFPLSWQQHKQWLPGALGAAGIVAMVVAFSVEEAAEAYWVTLSGGLLICGHLLNRHFMLKHLKRDTL